MASVLSSNVQVTAWRSEIAQNLSQNQISKALNICSSIELAVMLHLIFQYLSNFDLVIIILLFRSMMTTQPRAQKTQFFSFTF